MPDHYLAGATALAMLVPAAGVAFGLYRPVIRFHIPFLLPRAGLVGGLCGVLIAFWRVRWSRLMGVLA